MSAALANKVQHFVYVSVALPAPLMKAYIEVRKRREQTTAPSGTHKSLTFQAEALTGARESPHLSLTLASVVFKSSLLS